MTLEQKKETALLLQQYCNTFSTQNRAANSIRDASESTVIQILNNNWQQVSDKMWLNIYNQLKKRENKVEPYETTLFQTLVLYYGLAQDEGSTFAFVGGGGWGKSFTGKWFSNVNRLKNVYYLECAHYFNRKQFLQAMMIAMNKNHYGLSIQEMMETIVSELRKKSRPLFIIDEVDKLSDNVLVFFITLYNELNGLCGFVWQSTNNIEKRFRKAILRNITGYQELFSRIGKSFISLDKPNAFEIEQVCKAYGIDTTDRVLVNTIINESDGDLRRVERQGIKAKAIKKFREFKAA